MRTLFAFAFLTAALPAQAAEPANILREPTEWLEIRVNDATRTDLPRVLLLGDSISGGYFKGVTDALKGKAYVARLGTSKSLGDPALLQEVEMVLKQYRFDVIHFNNGLHGWEYTEADYRKAFPELINVLRKNAPDAKLIWATSTPRRMGAPDFQTFHPSNERVKERNRIAASIVAREGIPVEDLYALMENHPEWMSDGTHYKPEGIAVQVKQVVQSISAALPQ